MLIEPRTLHHHPWKGKIRQINPLGPALLICRSRIRSLLLESRKTRSCQPSKQIFYLNISMWRGRKHVSSGLCFQNRSYIFKEKTKEAIIPACLSISSFWLFELREAGLGTMLGLCLRRLLASRIRVQELVKERTKSPCPLQTTCLKLYGPNVNGGTALKCTWLELGRGGGGACSEAPSLTSLPFPSALCAQSLSHANRKLARLL